MKDNNKKFINAYSLKMIFIFFVIGCLFGTYYEEILEFIVHGHFESRQGLFWGPFSPIYGVGFACFIIFLGKDNDKRGILKTWFYASIISGIVEFMEHFIADKVYGVEFWNYSSYFLNIDGRTTIPYIICWGFGGMLLLKLVYPWIYKLVNKIPNLICNIVYYSLFIFLLVDVIITYTALGRMPLREKNINPLTFIGEYYDKVYTDEYLYKKFPIMKPVKK